MQLASPEWAGVRKVVVVQGALVDDGQACCVLDIMGEQLVDAGLGFEEIGVVGYGDLLVGERVQAFSLYG